VSAVIRPSFGASMAPLVTVMSEKDQPVPELLRCDNEPATVSNAAHLIGGPDQGLVVEEGGDSWKLFDPITSAQEEYQV